MTRASLAKYERCVRDVKAKQPVQCERCDYKCSTRSGHTCYNPWAVCSRLKPKDNAHGSVTTRGRKKPFEFVHAGPRGGLYTISRGKKKYIKRPRV